MQRRLILGIVSLAFLHASGAAAQETAPADGEDPFARVRTLDAEAGNFFANGDYAQAVERLVLAQQIAPAAPRLFNIAVCYDRLGQAERAIEEFERYLTTEGADDAGRSHANERIPALRAEIEERAAREAAEAEARAAREAAEAEARAAAAAEAEGRAQQQQEAARRRPVSPTAFWSTLGITAALGVTWAALSGYYTSIWLDYQDATDPESENYDTIEAGSLKGRGEDVDIAASVFLGLTGAAAVATVVLGVLAFRRIEPAA